MPIAESFKFQVSSFKLTNAPVLVAVGVAAVTLLLFQVTPRPVPAARAIVTGLAAGRPSVERSIDWEHLKALSVDVGATYAALPDDAERAHYRKSFISGFASAFRANGGTADAFDRWRIHARENTQVIVAADHRHGGPQLRLGLSAGWAKKLQSIQWQRNSEEVRK